MAQLRRSLFIGLGGTGIKTILRTKAVMLDNYQKDGILPPILGFLGIDTDAGEYDKTVESKHGPIKLSNREQYSISVDHPRQFYESYRRDFAWLSQKNTSAIDTLDRGAGQYRTNGRLAFMFHRTPLKQKLIDCINEVYTSRIDDKKWSGVEAMGDAADGPAKIEVHLVFSFCGGTGAGTFLDVAYLIREIARELNLGLTLNGYAVLPGVFEKEIKNLADKSRVKPNAYGAIVDLDYLMSLDKKGDGKTFRLNWRGAVKETSELPFDSVVLVDNKNTEGLVYSSISDLTEMLSLALLASTGQIGSNSSSVGDNVKYDIKTGAFDFEDKRAWVAAVGASALVYDSNDVAEVYARKAQNRIIDTILSYGGKDANTEANIWIDAVHIREHEKDDVIDKLFDISEITDLSLNEKDFNKRNVREKINSRVGMYYQGIEPTSDDWDKVLKQMVTEVSGQLDVKIKELLQTHYSIGLALGFLQEVHHQVNDIFLQEMRQEMDEHGADSKEAEAELATQIDTLHTYLNTGIFHNQTNNYISAIRNQAKVCITERMEVKRRSYAISFYSKIMQQLGENIARIEETKRNFESIREDNLKLIRSSQNRVNKTRVVEFDLAEASIKRVELDDTVFPIGEFVELLPNKSLYTPEKKETYAAALQKISTGLQGYKDILSKDIDTILNAMSESEFEDEIKRVFQRSKSFFRVDGHGRLIQDMEIGKQEVFYVCVPDTSTSRLIKDNAFQHIAKADYATPISTGLRDRIIIYRQKRPIPAFAISGIEEMGVQYLDKQDRVSFHFDEFLRQQLDKEFYSLDPKEANTDALVESWVKGCILHLIDFDKAKGSYVYLDETKQHIGLATVWTNLNTAYRDKAFEQFVNDAQISRQFDKKFEDYLANLGKVQVQELWNKVSTNYFKEFSRCQLAFKTVFGDSISVEYKGTLKMLKQEMDALPRIFNMA